MTAQYALQGKSLRSKVLSLGNTQINLVFRSLIRTSELRSKVLSLEKAKKILLFAHLLDKILTLDIINAFICSRLTEFFVPLNFVRKYSRSKKQKKFCFSLTYSYLCKKKIRQLC